MTICGNFLEIELDSGKVEVKSWEEIFEEKLGREKSVREIIGGFGRGLNYFALLNKYDDFSRFCAICTGFLTGHPHFGLPMTCCKTTLVFLSPVKRREGKYGISFANVGTNFGSEMKKMGVDDILIFGKAKQPVTVLLDGTGEGIEIEQREFDPDALVFDTLESIVKEYDYETICAVGPGAFRGIKFASAHFSTPLPGKKFGLLRTAGRGGIGLVLSAKNIKAIGVKGVDKKFPKAGSGGEEDRRIIKEINREIAGKATEKYRYSGTWGGNFDYLLPAKALPAYNHSKLLGEEDEEVYGLWREKLEEKGLKVEDEQCSPCPIKCVKKVKSSNGKIWRLDYEPVSLMGCDTGVFDLDVVLNALWLTNAYGLDAVSTGSTIAWYFEHNHRMGKSPTFGDKQALLELIRKIAFREGIGDVLAEGTKEASERLGDIDIAMQVKGLETPGYPAWSNPGYAFAVRGMCHTSMETYNVAVGRPDKVHDIEWWVSTLKKGAIDAMLVQSGGLCHFARKVILPALPKLLKIYTGVETNKEEIERSGLQTYVLSRAIDTVAGFARSDDALPERAFRFGTTKEWMEKLKDRFYKEMGFDKDGRVTPETLENHGLLEFKDFLRI